MLRKGALHVHSTYSDGELSLVELRRTLRAQGFDFACVADHAEWFDASRLQQYHSDIQTLSDNTFTFVPGLEYECERRLHVVGYGARALLSTNDPQEVIEQIEQMDAVSVIAHPPTELFTWIEGFDQLPSGIEVWNSKYDGRYAPRPEAFAALARLQQRRPNLNAFYGQDLHWRHQYRGLVVEIACDDWTPEAILTALRAGAFVGVIRDLRLPSSGVMPASRLAVFSRAHRRSDRIRQVVRAAKRVADAVRMPLPPLLKSQLRRIL